MPPTGLVAAIMFADIIGFTAIMQDDETLATGLCQHIIPSQSNNQ